MTSECWILESVIKFKMLPHLKTKDNQFGYKTGHSCVHAIGITQSLVHSDSAWVLTLDASSAFDKISHRRIYDQLTKRNVPDDLISVTMGLLYNSMFSVKWYGSESDQPIFAGRGTKQGGVLSAFLFSACYDNLIDELNSMNAGVNSQGIKFNNIVYADDICLFSYSKFGLMKLYKVVMKFADKYKDLVMNPSKSYILRMGTKKLPVSSFDGIPTTEATRYLGAQIAKNKKHNKKKNKKKSLKKK